MRAPSRIFPREHQAQLEAKPAFQSVYDGRICLGHILNRGKLGVEAFDANDRSLGVYPNRKTAAAVVSARTPS
jgi:hypothetical protein